MKKLLLLLSLSLILCSCELDPKTEETTDIADAETFSETTEEVTSTPATTEFVPDAGTSLSAKYDGDGYIACEFSDEAREHIYFVVDLDNGQTIRLDRDENVSLIPSVHDMVQLADINFDGTNDLCISIGGFGAQGALSYKAYINIDGKYELCEGFDEIPNPALDADNKLILGTSRQNAAQHAYSKYKIDNGKVIELETVIYNVADDTVEKDGTTYPASDFAEWDFIGEKWNNSL
ncbi:MAG: hypothetical protein IJN48_02770 [Clostridia bacterium]|nr:hypothetical protein [Clostridia bacterium]